MIITSDQSAYLGRLAFIRKVRKLLCEQFIEARRMPRHKLNPEIYQQLKRAEEYGLHSEHGAATYVVTAWLLGPAFDETFAVVRERLHNPSTSEPQKVLWLQTFSTSLLGGLERSADGE